MTTSFGRGGRRCRECRSLRRCRSSRHRACGPEPRGAALGPLPARPVRGPVKSGADHPRSASPRRVRALAQPPLLLRSRASSQSPVSPLMASRWRVWLWEGFAVDGLAGRLPGRRRREDCARRPGEHAQHGRRARPGDRPPHDSSNVLRHHDSTVRIRLTALFSTSGRSGTPPELTRGLPRRSLRHHATNGGGRGSVQKCALQRITVNTAFGGPDCVGSDPDRNPV